MQTLSQTPKQAVKHQEQEAFIKLVFETIFSFSFRCW